MAAKFKTCFIVTLLFLLLIPTKNLFAQVDTFEFDNEVQQRRFRTLSDELRCPMCQNTNLSGSSGGVAEDLRREIHRMIIAVSYTHLTLPTILLV